MSLLVGEQHPESRNSFTRFFCTAVTMMTHKKHTKHMTVWQFCRGDKFSSNIPFVSVVRAGSCVTQEGVSLTAMCRYDCHCECDTLSCASPVEKAITILFCYLATGWPLSGFVSQLRGWNIFIVSCQPGDERLLNLSLGQLFCVCFLSDYHSEWDEFSTHTFRERDWMASKWIKVSNTTHHKLQWDTFCSQAGMTGSCQVTEKYTKCDIK